MSWNPPLYAHADDAPAVPTGLPLVILLTGFTDAGGAVAQSIAYLREEAAPVTLLQFENDVLLDYRARRPQISFDTDHLTDYRPARLELSLAYDALSRPFLLLAGYEPDFAWDGFTGAVLGAAAAFAVSSVTWVHAIGMPVPHTRPLGTTVSGNRTALAEAHSVWKPHTTVPATVGHLLEHRFAQSGQSVAGFVLLVPHYLSDTEYPASAITALDSITAATGLVFAVDDLREQNDEFLGKVDEQVTASDELTSMLAGLEERYDAYMAGATQATPLLHEADLPSADEIAAELERFLASGSHDDDQRGPAFG